MTAMGRPRETLRGYGCWQREASRPCGVLALLLYGSPERDAPCPPLVTEQLIIRVNASLPKEVRRGRQPFY